MLIEGTSRPFLMAGLSVMILSGMDAAMKIVSGSYPIGEVVTLRYAAGTLFALMAFAAAGERRPGWPALRRNMIRAGVMVCTAATFFMAVARLPLAEAVALTFLAPLLLSVLGWMLLKEPIARRTGFGIALGLVGVGSAQEVDTGRGFDPVGIGSAVSCAFFYALSNVLMRKQGGVDSVYTVVALTNVFGLIITAPILLAGWNAPLGGHVAVFVVAGLLATMGHMCQAWAYARAQAGRLGFIEYSAFIWAALLGLLIFGEVPSARTLAGASLVIVACLLSTWQGPGRLRERNEPPVS